jgi:hypothetical protein
MQYPTVDELTAHGIPEEHWEGIIADNDIVGEIRLNRYLHAAKYSFNYTLINAAINAMTYASADKVIAYPGDPRGPHEIEPPDDLTGLFPDPEDFIRSVRIGRKANAKRVENLDAFNEDGRRRAIHLGFPPDSWVIKKEEIDYRPVAEILAEIRAQEPED